jgi:hypothetical protein
MTAAEIIKMDAAKRTSPKAIFLFFVFKKALNNNQNSHMRIKI